MEVCEFVLTGCLCDGWDRAGSWNVKTVFVGRTIRAMEQTTFVWKTVSLWHDAVGRHISRLHHLPLQEMAVDEYVCCVTHSQSVRYRIISSHPLTNLLWYCVVLYCVAINRSRRSASERHRICAMGGGGRFGWAFSIDRCDGDWFTDLMLSFCAGDTCDVWCGV